MPQFPKEMLHNYKTVVHDTFTSRSSALPIIPIVEQNCNVNADYRTHFLSLKRPLEKNVLGQALMAVNKLNISMLIATTASVETHFEPTLDLLLR